MASSPRTTNQQAVGSKWTDAPHAWCAGCQAEIDRLRAVLSFYADAASWTESRTRGLAAPAELDRGERARCRIDNPASARELAERHGFGELSESEYRANVERERDAYAAQAAENYARVHAVSIERDEARADRDHHEACRRAAEERVNVVYKKGFDLLQEARAEVERLRAALRWYSNAKRHELEDDDGETARKALTGPDLADKYGFKPHGRGP